MLSPLPTLRTAFYAAPQRKQEASPVDLTIPQIRPNFALGESYENSPRRRHLAKAGDQTIVSDTNHAYSPAPKHDNLPAAKVESDRPALAPPLPLLMKTFSPFADLSEDFWFKISPYFKPVHFEQGAVLWKQGDEAEGMYVIELGILKAVYKVCPAFVSFSDLLVSPP
jgi:SulP family sulfate permease